MTFKEYIKSSKIDDVISICSELDLSKIGLTDIIGIEKFTKLEILVLDENNLTDISPLSKLKKLHELVLENNNIKDIEPLKKLSNLEILYLDHNPISDITPLKNLKNLKILSLEFLPEILDSSSLKELKNVNNLFLKDTVFNDLSFLIYMDKLNNLQIDVDNFKEFSEEMLEVFFDSYRKYKKDIYLIIVKERRKKIISSLFQ